MTRRPPPRSTSSAAPGPSWPPTASSDSYGWSPTTGRATAPRPSPRPSLPGLAPPEDPPPHPTSQRQGRALQPHPGRGVPLCAHLLPQSGSSATPSRCGTTAIITIAPHTACHNQPPTTRVPAHATKLMTSYSARGPPGRCRGPGARRGPASRTTSTRRRSARRSADP